MASAGSRTLVLWAATVAVGLGLVAPAAWAGNEVDVSYSSHVALTRALARTGGQLLRDLPAIHVAQVASDRRADQFMRLLGDAPGVRASYVVDRRSAVDALTLGLVSTPAGGAYEWEYYATGVDRVPTTILSAARATTVAVLDTGVDLRAAGLAGKVSGTYDARSGKRTVEDKSGHGTFVTSLVGGTSGMSGFGGAARLLVVKVADTGDFNDFDVAAGILYAVKHGARVINLSVAGPTASSAEQAAVRYAAAHDVLLVAAAGNDALAGNAPEYPAAFLQPVGSNGVGGLGLSVAASDFAGVRAVFSEFGSFVSLAAPGASVLGALPLGGVGSDVTRMGLGALFGSSLAFASGTSFAAPQVAGAAALVWAAAPRLSAQRVAAVLEQSATGRGTWRPDIGYGVLDVARAVEMASNLRVAGD